LQGEDEDDEEAVDDEKKEAGLVSQLDQLSLNLLLVLGVLLQRKQVSAIEIWKSKMYFGHLVNDKRDRSLTG
jgi:hypothetical protein